MIPENTHLLQLVIVGGGIGGLVAAISLRRAGHAVTVLEQKPDYTTANAGGGINLTANATRCLFAIGLQDGLEAIADQGSNIFVREPSVGSLVQTVPGTRRWMVHRFDLLNLLGNAARSLGAIIKMGRHVEGISECDNRVVVSLDGGEDITADLLLGADGLHSQVRTHILGDRAVPFRLTGHCVFLLDVPQHIMESHESTAKLYEQGRDPLHIYMGNGSTIVCWTMSERKCFHMQVNDHAYGTGAALGFDDAGAVRMTSPLEDMTLFRKRFAEYGGAMGRIFAESPRALKWLIAELPELPTWSSDSGRMVLLGDAAHCFPPFAGQGSCMAIEDAAVLSDLLSGAAVAAAAAPARKGTASEAKAAAVCEAVKWYEQVRKPRVAGVRAIVEANVARWASREGGGAMNEEQRAQQAAAGRWISEYEAVEEARKGRLEGRQLVRTKRISPNARLS